MVTRIVFLLFLLFSSFSRAGEFYKWVDEEGTVHMTDNLSQVPLQYRNQAETKPLEPNLPLQENSGLNTSEKPSGHLKRFTVPYQPFEGTSRRIIIPVTLNDSVEARLLLDTGSPGLLISPDLADRLGLPDEQHGGLKVMAAGVGGSTSAVLAVVDTIRVGDARGEFLPATITKVPSGEFEGLVGMDFMANYRVGIDIKNDVVVFEELPPQVDRPGGHDEAWWRSNFRNFSKLKSDWDDFIASLEISDLISSEKERRRKIAREQYEAADALCRKLERYARDNTVPIDWRR